ncbi:hypothetical protein LINPERPRIM_LOCUS13445, partial [Linum perenne]
LNNNKIKLKDCRALPRREPFQKFSKATRQAHDLGGGLEIVFNQQ